VAHDIGHRDAFALGHPAGSLAAGSLEQLVGHQYVEPAVSHGGAGYYEPLRSKCHPHEWGGLEGSKHQPDAVFARPAQTTDQYRRR